MAGSVGALLVDGAQVPQVKKKVFFIGTGAVKEGMAMSYDSDATNVLDRAIHVELTDDDLVDFAGAAAGDYPANANGQWIDIFLPGSFCNVYLNEDQSNGTLLDVLAPSDAGDGTWSVTNATEGYGAALLLELVDRSTTAGNCFARLLTGTVGGIAD